MTPVAPVGAHKKLPLPLTLGVAVLALSACACGQPPKQDNPDGGCRLDCGLYPTPDGGKECLC
jgi:hypothetical protein